MRPDQKKILDTIKPILTELLDDAVNKTEGISRERLRTSLLYEADEIIIRISLGTRVMTARVDPDKLQQETDKRAYLDEALQLDFMIGVMSINL